MDVWVCLCVYIWEYSLRPGEGIRTPGTGLQVVVGCWCERWPCTHSREARERSTHSLSLQWNEVCNCSSWTTRNDVIHPLVILLSDETGSAVSLRIYSS